MKKEYISITMIITLFVIIVLLLVKDQTIPNTIVYCKDQLIPIDDSSCSIADVPPTNSEGQLNPDDVILYYKIDDNCNFQTLFFSPNKEAPFTCVGRFTGELLPNKKYKIKKLEVKLYVFDDSLQNKIKVSNIKLDKTASNEKGVIFKVQFGKVTEGDNINEVDYIYGVRSDDNPIILGKNASIIFNIDTNNTIVFPGGGYECDGIATTSF